MDQPKRWTCSTWNISLYVPRGTLSSNQPADCEFRASPGPEFSTGLPVLLLKSGQTHVAAESIDKKDLEAPLPNKTLALSTTCTVSPQIQFRTA